MRISRIVLLAMSVLLVSVSAAKADTVISASGTWGTAACTPPSCIAPEYAPGGSWSFSFHVSDPATDVVATPAGGFQTHQVSDFVYLLNGNPVAVTLPDADFFDTANLGLFDLDLSDVNTFTLTGPQVFGGSPPPTMTFIPGVFTADLVQIFPETAVAGVDLTGDGTVTITSSTTSVPEPGTLLLLGVALFGLLFTRISKG